MSEVFHGVALEGRGHAQLRDKGLGFRAQGLGLRVEGCCRQTHPTLVGFGFQVEP